MEKGHGNLQFSNEPGMVDFTIPDSRISSTKVNSPTVFVQLRWLVVGLVLQFPGTTKAGIELGLLFRSKPQMSLSFCPFGKDHAIGTWQKGMM